MKLADGYRCVVAITQPPHPAYRGCGEVFVGIQRGIDTPAHHRGMKSKGKRVGARRRRPGDRRPGCGSGRCSATAGQGRFLSRRPGLCIGSTGVRSQRGFRGRIGTLGGAGWYFTGWQSSEGGNRCRTAYPPPRDRACHGLGRRSGSWRRRSATGRRKAVSVALRSDRAGQPSGASRSQPEGGLRTGHLPV